MVDNKYTKVNYEEGNIVKINKYMFGRAKAKLKFLR